MERARSRVFRRSGRSAARWCEAFVAELVEPQPQRQVRLGFFSFPISQKSRCSGTRNGNRACPRKQHADRIHLISENATDLGKFSQHSCLPYLIPLFSCHASHPMSTPDLNKLKKGELIELSSKLQHERSELMEAITTLQRAETELKEQVASLRDEKSNLLAEKQLLQRKYGEYFLHNMFTIPHLPRKL